MDLTPSTLGTVEYWEEFYKNELKNLREEHPSEGGWFEEYNAAEKVVEFIEENDLVQGDVLELGAGEGNLLFLIYDTVENRSNARYTGVDYSPTAIVLSNEKVSARSNFEFIEADLLDATWAQGRTWNLIVDKGTLDAIALAPYDTTSPEGRALLKYPREVSKLLDDDGVLIITSCNFTQPELEGFICKDTDLEPWKSLHFPTFEFGGKKGQSICTVAFKRPQAH